MKRWNTLFAFALILLIAGVGHAQEKRPMTFDDIMALKNVGAPEISPDGKSIVYTVTSAAMADNENRPEIWLISTEEAGSARRFTSGNNDRSPKWSPDGEWIAFISSRPVEGRGQGNGGDGNAEGNRSQIYLISPHGGEAVKLSDSPSGVGSFAWVARLNPDSLRRPDPVDGRGRETTARGRRSQSDRRRFSVFEPSRNRGRVKKLQGDRERRFRCGSTGVVPRRSTDCLQGPTDSEGGRWESQRHLRSKLGRI